MRAVSMHACIENAQKGKIIYVPAQWVTLITCAKVIGKPYTVIEVSNDEFLDFKPLVNDKKYNWKTSFDGSKILWNGIKEISVTFENPFEINIKYNLSASDFIKINISLKKNKEEDINFA